MTEKLDLETILNQLREQVRDLDDDQLEQIQDMAVSERIRRDIIATARKDAQEAAERYAEAVKDDPAHEWSPGSVIGPGERVLEDDTEFVNTSKAWLSVPPSEYPLGYERVETPIDVAPFVAGENVKPGDLREYEGVVYQVLKPHETADHWAPDVAHSLWTKA